MKRASAGGLDTLESRIVARAGGLSEAALIAEGLHVLPSFIGRRAPAADPAARGGIVGLDLREDAASLDELYVAGLCGLAYGIADIVGAFARAGYDFETIVVSGGAAQSALVRQIIADACGKAVSTPETAEPVLLGSAMIGAVAAGKETLRSAMASMSASRRRSRAGERLGRDVSRAQAPRPRDPAAGRTRGPQGDARRDAGRKSSSSTATACWSTAKSISLTVTRRMLGEAGLRLSDDETRERFLGMRQDAVLEAHRDRTRRASAKGFRRDAVERDPRDL